jgi:hypothetical protein
MFNTSERQLRDKSEFIGFRITRFERRLAEAVAAKREHTAETSYSLSDLVRESLINAVREDLREELAAT